MLLFSKYIFKGSKLTHIIIL